MRIDLAAFASNGSPVFLKITSISLFRVISLLDKLKKEKKNHEQHKK